jgi:dienelactone hydrolase
MPAPGRVGMRSGVVMMLAGLMRLIFGVVFTSATAVAAEPQVTIPSLDRSASGELVQLLGHWFATTASPAPAVLLLHGCGGAYAANGRLSVRMRDYAAWINRQGFHALVLDSLTPRGERELCTQRIGTRRVTIENRRLDAIAGVAWLAQRGDVQPQRIGLLGWSHGGSTVLAATNLHHPAARDAAVQPAFAIAFYPGCEAELKRGYAAAAELLVLVGEADDWTPAEPCRQLAASASGRDVRLVAYAGAYHGFDSNAPLRRRLDVPNGARPGEGVHVGGDAAAREQSREEVRRFLGRQ